MTTASQFEKLQLIDELFCIIQSLLLCNYSGSVRPKSEVKTSLGRLPTHHDRAPLALALSVIFRLSTSLIGWRPEPFLPFYPQWQRPEIVALLRYSEKKWWRFTFASPFWKPTQTHLWIPRNMAVSIVSRFLRVTWRLGIKNVLSVVNLLILPKILGSITPVSNKGCKKLSISLELDWLILYK